MKILLTTTMVLGAMCILETTHPAKAALLNTGSSAHSGGHILLARGGGERGGGARGEARPAEGEHHDEHAPARDQAIRNDANRNNSLNDQGAWGGDEGFGEYGASCGFDDAGNALPCPLN